MLIFLIKKTFVFLLVIFIITLLSLALGFSFGVKFSSFFEYLTSYFNMGIFDPSVIHAQSLYFLIFPTLLLFVGALLFAMLIGFPLGLYLGLLSNRLLKYSIKIAFLLIYSAPITLIAIFFGDYFNLNIMTHTNDIIEINSLNSFSINWREFIVPLTVLVLFPCMITIQIVSRNVENTVQQNFIKISFLRYYSKFKVIRKHLLPNVIPISIKQLLHYLSMVLFFTMVIEIMFNLQGIGVVAFNAYQKNDFVVISQLIWLSGLLLSALWLIVELVVASCYPFTLNEE